MFFILWFKTFYYKRFKSKSLHLMEMDYIRISIMWMDNIKTRFEKKSKLSYSKSRVVGHYRHWAPLDTMLTLLFIFIHPHPCKLRSCIIITLSVHIPFLFYNFYTFRSTGFIQVSTNVYHMRRCAYISGSKVKVTW